MPSLRSDDDVPSSCLAPLLSLFKTGSDRTKKGAASTSLALPSNQRSSGQSSSSAASVTSPSSSSEKASKPWFGQHQIEGLDEVDPPSYGLSEETDVGRPFAGQNVLAAIKSDMTALSPDLRMISCKIHGEYFILLRLERWSTLSALPLISRQPTRSSCIKRSTRTTP